MTVRGFRLSWQASHSLSQLRWGTALLSVHGLRASPVGTTGKVTLRWHGDLKRLYVGRRWAGQPIAVVCIDNVVEIVATESGEQVGRYVLVDGQRYFPNQLTARHKKKDPGK